MTLCDDVWPREWALTKCNFASSTITGKSLNATIPANIQQLCSKLDWPCLDPAIHTRSTVQHSNYDERAACGDGCSGNPWDAGWSITPTGWGEAHELGHNMQVKHLNIHYPPTGTGDRNAWSTLVNRAGENSNNVFPYYVLWNYYRIFRNYTGSVTDDHMIGKVRLRSERQAEAIAPWIPD